MMFRVTKLSQNDNKEIEHLETDDEGDIHAKRIVWEREKFKVKIEDEDGKLYYESGR